MPEMSIVQGIALERNGIMTSVSIPGQDSIDAQREMFRLAEKEAGLSASAIAAKTPIPLSTLKGWRNGAAMPAWAIGQLGAAGVPDHLLSLLLEPFGRAVVTCDGGNGDLDQLGREGAHYLAEHADAKADGVVTPIERARLGDRARRLAGAARQVACGT
jgi:hypothetical protein